MKRLGPAALALALAGCGDDAVPAPAARPAVSAYDGTLSAELRGTAEVSLRLDGAGGFSVTLSLAGVETMGLLAEGAPIVATGRVEPIPETNSELFVATFAPTPAPGGACGDLPVSLALSLHRRHPNLRFAGALTTYCGDRAAGVPARIFRLSGELTAM